MEAPINRPIHEIADEIRGNWKNVWFGAEPYPKVMEGMETLDDDYYLDSGREIVLRFLGNAAQWRGETARRVKTELKQMLGIK